MSIVYFDTSALIKLVLVESESTAMIRYARSVAASNDVLLTSEIGRTEFSRVLKRVQRARYSGDEANEVFRVVQLLKFSEQDLIAAAGFPDFELRTLDAIHLAAALRARCDTMVTYDKRLFDIAPRYGVHTVRPRSAGDLETTDQ